MSTIDEIKARIDIVDLVSETVQLRRSGKSYTGFCPFHPNTRTPAFVVFPESGTWRCFGQCNEGGDIFRFVMKKEGWDFPQTLKALAERAGVELRPPSPQEQETAEEHARLRDLLEEAATFYRQQLFHTPAGEAALDYLHQRGLNDPILETFGLGYAPDAWEAGMQYLLPKGYTPDELSQVGLVTERDSGGYYDRFRNRIMFPIRELTGKMVGFGARILNPNDQPKFLNSPQTVLFDKGSLLYGLDLARKPIRSQDQVVIVEGYLDVIALHQGGFSNTVSPMGTALTEMQLRMLKRFTRRIILALDADAAGEKATLRGLEVARQTLDRSDEMTFDARGLLHHEARLQADLRVTTLPEGLDPDEVVQRDPAEWSSILAAAKPVVVHVMETLALGHNLDDPKVKSSIAAQVLPLIEDVPNPVERDAYRQQLARLLRVDERALQGTQSAPSRPRRRAAPPTQAARSTPPTLVVVDPAHHLEAYALSVLLHHPERIHLLDRALQEAGLSPLDIVDFERTDHQMILRLIRESVEQVETDPSAFILNDLTESISERVQFLLQSPLPSEPNQEKLIEDLTRAVMRARFLKITQTLNQLRFLLEETQDQGDLLVSNYKDQVKRYALDRDRLDRALGQSSVKR